VVEGRSAKVSRGGYGRKHENNCGRQLANGPRKKKSLQRKRHHLKGSKEGAKRTGSNENEPLLDSERKNNRGGGKNRCIQRVRL